jgi:DASH complex subunit ASK1
MAHAMLTDSIAREASKRIVDDLLMTAGGDITDSTGGMDDDSPSVVRRQVDLDDSF